MAPARSGSYWLALKALPLALVWPGLTRGSLRARQLASLLLPFYIADAIVRAMAASGRQGVVAWAVAALGVAAFVALLASFRRAR